MFLLACTDYKLDATPDPTLKPGPAIEVSSKYLDFGDVSQASTQDLTVSSIGDETLKISQVLVVGSGSFTLLSDITGELLSKEQTSLQVAFTPVTPDNAGQAVIYSNDPANPTVGIDLSGRGVVPMLVIDPLEVDFGMVPIWGYESATLRLSNVGYADLHLDPPALTGSFGMTALAETTLAPGEETEIMVDFAADLEGDFTGEIWFPSDSASGPLRVGLSAQVASVPVAICGAAPAPAIPGESMIWVGDSSYDPGHRNIISYEWTLISRPTASAASLNGSGATRAMGVDLAGTYSASLVVTNDLGIQSEPCIATVDAVPLQDLWVELFWSVEKDDLDLHLWQEGESWYGAGDCYFGNCRDGLEWGESDNEEDNPSLDLDDIYGLGPENINMMHPAAGEYSVGVQDFWGQVVEEANPATINIYVYGALAWTGTRAIMGEDSMTEIAVISFPSGDVTER